MLKKKKKMKQLVMKLFLFRRFVMVSGILLLTFYKKIIYIFHNHVSQSAELSLSFKNDVKISRHYLSVWNSAEAL